MWRQFEKWLYRGKIGMILFVLAGSLYYHQYWWAAFAVAALFIIRGLTRWDQKIEAANKKEH